MNRSLWGELEDGTDKMPEVQMSEMVLPHVKRERFATLRSLIEDEDDEEITTLPLQNNLVNQTVDVMNQTECIQTLIDTYTSDTGVLNPCQLVPKINFQTECIANLVTNRKRVRSLNFIPPKETKFTNGITMSYPKINHKIAEAAIKKSLCGLLRLAGFDECTESAMSTFVQAVEHFYSSLLDGVKKQMMHDSKDREYEIDAITLEKAYQNLTTESLLNLNHYYNKEVILRNAQEKENYKEKYTEYDKLVQESHNNMQKSSIKEEEDYMRFLNFTSTRTEDDPVLKYVFTNSVEGVDNSNY